jgi:hypothetical protein
VAVGSPSRAVGIVAPRNPCRASASIDTAARRAVAPFVVFFFPVVVVVVVVVARRRAERVHEFRRHARGDRPRSRDCVCSPDTHFANRRAHAML